MNDLDATGVQINEILRSAMTLYADVLEFDAATVQVQTESGGLKRMPTPKEVEVLQASCAALVEIIRIRLESVDTIAYISATTHTITSTEQEPLL